MRVKDIAWLAGLLEGEGNFISDPKGSLARIKLEMKDRDIVDRAAGLLGAKSVNSSKKKNPRHNTTYVCYVCGKQAAGWMLTLYSFLGKRRRRQVKRVILDWLNADVSRYALMEERGIRQRGRG